MAAPNLEYVDSDPVVLEAATLNWPSRGQQRENNTIKVATGRLDVVESSERIEANARFRDKALEATRQSAAAMAARFPTLDLPQECVIRGRDILGIEFLETAAASARSVGRVHIHYETDTEPASSGSPVFSNYWG